MTARANTLLATLLGVFAVVLGLAGPAGAAGSHRWVGVDASHDVAAYTCSPGPCRWKPAAANASADMTKEVVTYRHDSIQIVVNVRKVDPSSAFALTSVLKKTELGGRYYGVIAAFSPGKTPKVTIRNPHGTPVSCGAASPKLDGNQIKVTVPARCLHSPDWIRWSGYMRVIFPGDLDDDAQFEGYFDKFRSPSSEALNKNTFQFSRRVYRAA